MTATSAQKRGLIKITQILLGFIVCLLPCSYYMCRYDGIPFFITAFSVVYMVANFASLNCMQMKRYAPLERKYLLVSALLCFVAVLASFGSRTDFDTFVLTVQMLLHMCDLNMFMKEQKASENVGMQQGDADVVDLFVSSTRKLLSAISWCFTKMASKRRGIKFVQLFVGTLILVVPCCWHVIVESVPLNEIASFCFNWLFRQWIMVFVGSNLALMAFIVCLDVLRFKVPKIIVFEQVCVLLCSMGYLGIFIGYSQRWDYDWSRYGFDRVDVILTLVLLQSLLSLCDFLFAWFEVSSGEEDKKPLISVNTVGCMSMQLPDEKKSAAETLEV